MKSTTPFPYFGSKQRLAPWIASLLPAHDAYVEACAGSAAVLFAKPPSKVEVLNDLDGGVVAFFRCLRDRPDALARACQLTPYARAEHALAADGNDLDALERARRFWVRVTQGFNATSNGSWSPPVTAARVLSQPDEVARKADRLTLLAKRLRRVSVEQRPADELVRAWTRPGTVLYVDPPYPYSVRTGAQGHPQSRGYAVEMPDEAHEALADAVAAAVTGGAQAIVSGYRCALYDRLYPADGGWRRLDRAALAGSNAARGGPPSIRIESVWVSSGVGAQRTLFDPADAADTVDLIETPVGADALMGADRPQATA